LMRCSAAATISAMALRSSSVMAALFLGGGVPLCSIVSLLLPAWV
jgi:hypothetical protein